MVKDTCPSFREDQNSGPNTHNRSLTNILTLDARDLVLSLDFCKHLHIPVHIYMLPLTHTKTD